MMKRVGKISFCLAGGLVLNAGLRAEIVALPDNPYAPIVVRNVFDLNPPQKADTAPVVEAAPPPKITLNGIMDVFGHLQALYKVSDSGKPGQPAKDNSYILGEGQRQDDVEVVKINEKDAVVTFNNHGTVQELPLASQSAIPAPAAAGNPNVPGFHPNASAGANPFGGPASVAGGGANVAGGVHFGGAGGNNFNGLPPTSAPANTPATQQQQPSMTPEEQVIMIEAQRMQYQSENNPVAKLLPNTVLTPGNGDNNGDSQTPQ